MMVQRETRYVLAAVQAVIGGEWLVSGTNKLLSGSFPQGLASALDKGLKDNPNGWYVTLLQQIVLPHAAFFGYVIEGLELTIGVVLLGGALLLLGRPRLHGEPQHRLALVQFSLAAAAAALCVFLCINFHFWMGDGIIPTLSPAHPFDEGIDLDTLMPPIALVLMIANLRLLVEITEGRAFAWLASWGHRLTSRVHVGAASHSAA